MRGSETFPNPWKRRLSKVSLMLNGLLNEKVGGNMSKIMCDFIVCISTCDWLIQNWSQNVVWVASVRLVAL